MTPETKVYRIEEGKQVETFNKTYSKTWRVDQHGRGLALMKLNYHMGTHRIVYELIAQHDKIPINERHHAKCTSPHPSLRLLNDSM